MQRIAILLTLFGAFTFQINKHKLEPDVPELVAEKVYLPKQQPTPLATPIQEPIGGKFTVKLPDSELQCLAKNIYHEAGVEPDTGKIAVGQVTLNRLKTGRWGKSVCDVVYASKQFSWTLLPHKVREKPQGPRWEASLKASMKVLAGERVKHLNQSLFYHTDYIKRPEWADKKLVVAKIGQHFFYNKAKRKEEPKKKVAVSSTRKRRN